MRRRLLIIGVLVVLWAVPAPARRAVTVTEKLVMSTSDPGVNYDTGDAKTWTMHAGSSTFALASDEVGLCFTAHQDADTVEAVASLTHNGVGWAQIASSVYGTSDVGSTSAWRVIGAQASSSIAAAITGGADNQIGFQIACYALKSVENTPLQAKTGSSAATTTHTLTMDDARTADAVLLAWYATVIPIASETFTAEGTYTAGTVGGFTSPGNQGAMQYVVGGADITPTWTTGTNAGTVMIGVEFAEAAAGTTPCYRGLLRVGC
jgi:hypothetical protein